jgi:hypothetical protein
MLNFNQIEIKLDQKPAILSVQKKLLSIVALYYKFVVFREQKLQNVDFQTKYSQNREKIILN